MDELTQDELGELEYEAQQAEEDFARWLSEDENPEQVGTTDLW